MNKTLFKAIQVVDSQSEWNGELVDVLVQDGIFKQIGKSIPADAETKTIALENARIAPGFLDLRARSGEPGNEISETLLSLSKAAAYGGFTKVCVLPETDPVVENKGQLQFIASFENAFGLKFFPIAAVTKKLEGQKLNDLIDLKTNGAIAFSDGTIGIQNPDVVFKVLQYLQHTDSVLMQRPLDATLASGALVNDSMVATLLGLKGFSTLSEVSFLQRDLNIMAETGGKMHFSTLSCAESVEELMRFRKLGVKATCDVSALQLSFTEEALMEYDENYKVNPPLRSEANRLKLIDLIKQNQIDAIVSDHTPVSLESKDAEFDVSKFGMSSIQSVFSSLRTYTDIEITKIIDLLTYKPASVLDLPTQTITEGNAIDFTLFSTQNTWIPQAKNWYSKSFNSPLKGKTLQGKILGIGTQKGIFVF